jgi:hypothetical protein
MSGFSRKPNAVFLCMEADDVVKSDTERGVLDPAPKNCSVYNVSSPEPDLSRKLASLG